MSGELTAAREARPGRRMAHAWRGDPALCRLRPSNLESQCAAFLVGRVLPLGGYLVCLHGSLQHEVVHGHPSRSAWLNEALVFPSLWLWLLSFRIYREMHLLHHRDQQLTCPVNDPESNYLFPETWAAMGPAAQLFWRALGTVTGQMVVGPAFFGGRFWWRELSRLFNRRPLSSRRLDGSTSRALCWYSRG